MPYRSLDQTSALTYSPRRTPSAAVTSEQSRREAGPTFGMRHALRRIAERTGRTFGATTRTAEGAGPDTPLSLAGQIKATEPPIPTQPASLGLMAARYDRAGAGATLDNAAYHPGDSRTPGDARLIPAKTTSNGANWVLDPDLQHFRGTVEVPRPSGGGLRLEKGSPRYHTYQYAHVIEGADKLSPEELRRILRANVAPNDDLKAATGQGSNNDAAFRAPFNQVKSYDRVSSDGQYWVVNVTRSAPDGLHLLSDGWVASTFVRRADGKVVLLTYGEGDSFLQDSKTALGQAAEKFMNEPVWQKRADHVQRDVGYALQYEAIKRLLDGRTP